MSEKTTAFNSQFASLQVSPRYTPLKDQLEQSQMQNLSSVNAKNFQVKQFNFRVKKQLSGYDLLNKQKYEQISNHERDVQTHQQARRTFAKGESVSMKDFQKKLPPQAMVKKVHPQKEGVNLSFGGFKLRENVLEEFDRMQRETQSTKQKPVTASQNQSRKIVFKNHVKGAENFKKELNLEDLLLNEKQGMNREIRDNILLDFQGQEHQMLKKYKKLFEESMGLREEVKELLDNIEVYENGKLVKKDPLLNDRVISFDEMFEYLNQDEKFRLQDSYDPAEKLINQANRKSKERLQKDEKMNIFDIREIFNRANNFNLQEQKEITEKEIREVLYKDYKQKNEGKYQDPEIPQSVVEERLRYFEYLSVIEDFNARQSKQSEQQSKKLEKKEIERAESNAQLAYHYSKLKKYMSEQESTKFMSMLQVGVEKKKGLFKGKMEGNEKNIDKRLSQPKNRQKINDELKDEQERLKPDNQKKGFYAELQKIKYLKMQVNPYKPQTDVVPLQDRLIKNPDQKIYRDQQIEALKQIKHYQVPQQLHFEEMMDNNLRTINGAFQKIGSRSIPFEEEMMLYAQQFKQKVIARENLNNNITRYIKENQQKLDEFLEWNKNQIDKRSDINHCFYEYVKKKLKD